MGRQCDLDTDESFVLKVVPSWLILHYLAAFLILSGSFYMAFEGLTSGIATESGVEITVYSLLMLVLVAVLPRVRVYHSVWVDREEHTITLDGPGIHDELPIQAVNFVTHLGGGWRSLLRPIRFFTLGKTYRISAVTPGLDRMLRMMAAEYDTVVEEPVYKIIKRFTADYCD